VNLAERQACDGLDDASIMETMAWLKEQCLLLQFELERCSNVLTNTNEGDTASPSLGESEQ
jgi:hypothetical protein